MVVFGKGSKKRRVPIGSQTKKALIDYITRERGEAANSIDDDLLFLNEDHNPITVNVVEKMLQRINKAENVPKLHPMPAGIPSACANWSTGGIYSACRRSSGTPHSK